MYVTSALGLNQPREAVLCREAGHGGRLMLERSASEVVCNADVERARCIRHDADDALTTRHTLLPTRLRILPFAQDDRYLGVLLSKYDWTGNLPRAADGGREDGFELFR